MDKTALVELLIEERARVNKRIRRHEDTMPEYLTDSLVSRRDTLNFVLNQLEDQKVA